MASADGLFRPRLVEMTLLVMAATITAWAVRRMRHAQREEIQVRTLAAARDKVCAAEIHRAQEAAGVADRAKSAFLGTISHELRTPLNGVIGNAEILLGSSLEPGQRARVATIHASAEGLLGIVNDLLDFSRVEKGEYVLEQRLFELRQPLSEVVKIAGEQTTARDVEVVLEIASDVPTNVYGDPLRVRQVVQNLVSNAVKFTPQGHIAVRVARMPSSVGDDRVDVKFTVTDTGIGIPSAQHRSIFEHLSAHDDFSTRRTGGAGLGLAITQGLVDLMGGKIGLTSKPGHGSTFWFTLPLRVEEPPARLLPGPALSVLIVDRIPAAATALKSLLDAMRISCAIAPSAPAVLALLRSAVERQEPFDCVMMDHVTAEAQAGELPRAIATGPGLAATKLVLLTRGGDRTVLPPSDFAAFAGVLVKPVVRSDQVLQALRECRTPARTEADAEVENLARKRLRLLVAEDNAVNRSVAGGMLQKLGCLVEFAENGADAVHKTRQHHYDLILMDCLMPEMDGWAAAREIRRRDARTPIVALTANATNEDRSRCMQVGMNDYLNKPLRIADLARVMIRWAE